MASRVGQQFGNYRLIRLLGQGGFAEVYLAEHRQLGMKAAIKILHASLSSSEISAFRQEARTIAELSHPHIIRVLDFDVEHGTPFLVLDYASKGSLRHIHPKGSTLPLDLIVTYVEQIASALQYAHEHKLIHRDVKPENVLIGEHDELLLTDFGIATIAHSTSSMSTEASMGTLAYMAPEQIQGKPRKESDQYALAVTVYQWITGELPFQGSSTEMIAQHLAVPAPPLREKMPDLEVSIEQVVLKALSKDPKERFDRIQAFAEAFVQVSDFTSRKPEPPLLSPQPPSSSQIPNLRTEHVQPSDPKTKSHQIDPSSPSVMDAHTPPMAPSSPIQTTQPAAMGRSSLQRQKREGYVLAGALTLIWLLVMLFAVQYAINKSTLQLPPNTIEISYSAFQFQIQAGNVQTVTFIGESDIVGTLKEAITSGGGPSVSFHTIQLPNGDDKLPQLLMQAGIKVTYLPPLDRSIGGILPIGMLPIVTLLIIFLIGILLFFRWNGQLARRT